MTEKASARAERIGKANAAFRKIRIDYPPMTAAIEVIEELRVTTRHRDEGEACGAILLDAPIGTGKSMTLATAAAHAAAGVPDGHTPILVVQMPTAATTDSLPTAILKALGHPRPDLGKAEARWLRATADIRRRGVEIVAFDEFNRAGRRPTMSRPIAMAIREHVMDAGVAAVAFVGTAEASVVLGQCPDILDRLDGEIDLSPLEWSVEEDRELFVRFVADLDEALVDGDLLDAASGLACKEIARPLCEACDGRLRPLMGIVRTAMGLALRRHAPSIAIDDLRQAVDAYSLRAGIVRQNPFS